MFFELFILLFSENEEKLVSFGSPISQVAQSQSLFVSQVPQTTFVVFATELEQTFTRETLNQMQAKIPVEFGVPRWEFDYLNNNYVSEAQWIASSGDSYVKLNEGDFLSRFPPLLPHEISKHVRIKVNGRVIGRGGKVIRVTSTTPIPENTLEARIPLDEWLNWRFFDNPGDTSDVPAATAQSRGKTVQAGVSEPSGSGQQDPNDPRKPKPSKESASLPVPVREAPPVHRDPRVGRGEPQSRLQEVAQQVRTDGSETLWRSRNNPQIRLDVENQNPSSRPGQIHVHAEGEKYIYKPETGKFLHKDTKIEMPKRILEELKRDPKFEVKLKLGLEKYLGIKQ